MGETTKTKKDHDLIKRYSANPIISAEDMPFRCNSVFNAAATRYGDEYLLLLRVEDMTGRSVFALATSQDGYDFTVYPHPVMAPSPWPPFSTYEERGIEDPRITMIEDEYYIMYTAYSDYGCCLGLARTRDFIGYDRIGIVSQPENKDGCLFPRKIDGRYARLDRPIGAGVGNIWVSYSEDLIHWGDSRCVMTTRAGMWDTTRIGASVPPIETEEGWLEIYHGVKQTASGPIYRLGAVLLDLADPSKVIGRAQNAILTPRDTFERVGDINNVVFSCGAVPDDDGNLIVYYGAGDTCICAGTTTTAELVTACQEGPPHKSASSN